MRNAALAMLAEMCTAREEVGLGRPRIFDENAALDAAIDCFWRHGYEATSVRDLAAQMRITGASLYNAFGDKRRLFKRALQRYVDGSSRRRIAELDASSDPAGALRQFFLDLIESSLNDHRGCLLVNSAMEMAPRDDELGAQVRASLWEIEQGFRRTIEAAQRQRAVSGCQDASDLARLLLGVVIAIRVLARATSDRGLLEGVARPALALLGRGAEPHA